MRPMTSGWRSLASGDRRSWRAFAKTSGTSSTRSACHAMRRSSAPGAEASSCTSAPKTCSGAMSTSPMSSAPPRRAGMVRGCAHRASPWPFSAEAEMTCVVKIGGSLARDPLLARWLALLAEAGGGRVVIVTGGGPFAGQARHAHARWAPEDVVAHNMAVLGMAQYAMQMHGICKALVPGETAAAIRDALRQGRTALWMPYEVVRSRADALTSFDVTSDSLAAWLARSLGAT